MFPQSAPSAQINLNICTWCTSAWNIHTTATSIHRSQLQQLQVRFTARTFLARFTEQPCKNRLLCAQRLLFIALEQAYMHMAQHAGSSCTHVLWPYKLRYLATKLQSGAPVWVHNYNFRPGNNNVRAATRQCTGTPSWRTWPPTSVRVAWHHHGHDPSNEGSSN